MNAPITPGILTRLPGPPRKAVIVGQTRLGGFLCTTPALRALKCALPGTEMVMIAPPALRDLVARSLHLDRFVALPDLMFEQAERPIDVRGFTQFLREMQAERFDLGVQLRGYGLRSSPFFVLLGAAVNVGFVGPADTSLLDAALPFPREGHLIDRFLQLTAFLGAPPAGRHTECPLSSQDRATAATLLAGVPRPLIGVHPTASEAERVWCPDRFAEAAARLLSRYGGTVVIVTDRGGRSAADLIAGRVEGRCLNLAGMTSLPVLGAVIECLSLFVSNDTGPAHIAYALGVPTVTLFAALARTPFWPPEIGPFFPLTCQGSQDSISLDSITVDQVIGAVEELRRGRQGLLERAGEARTEGGD